MNDEPTSTESETETRLGVRRRALLVRDDFRVVDRRHGARRDRRRVLASEPLTNRDGRGMGVVFCDGHVEWIEAPRAAKVVAELEAEANPPPTLNAGTR